jgi:hypothetical protein
MSLCFDLYDSPSVQVHHPDHPLYGELLRYAFGMNPFTDERYNGKRSFLFESDVERRLKSEAPDFLEMKRKKAKEAMMASRREEKARFAKETEGLSKEECSEADKARVKRYVQLLKDQRAASHASTFTSAHTSHAGLSGDTLVSTREGTSVRLEDLMVGQQVMGFALDNTRHVPRTVTEVASVDSPSSVELYFSNGTTLVCAPHQLIHTARGYVRANQLVDGTVLRGGITMAIASPLSADEAEAETEWLQELTDTIGWPTSLTMPQAHALARIMGFLLSDGTVWGDGHTTLYIGHAMDQESMRADFRLLGLDDGTSTVGGGVFNLNHRARTGQSIAQAAQALGIEPGRRADQMTSLPAQFGDWSCPVSVTCEFLGGLFGGDGFTTSLVHDTEHKRYSSVRFAWSRTGVAAVRRLHNVFSTVLDPMIVRCGVGKGKFYVSIREVGISSRTEEGRAEIDALQRSGVIIESTVTLDELVEGQSYCVCLNLTIDDTFAFYKNVGFRHCLYKQLRLHAAMQHRAVVQAAVRSRIRLVDTYHKLNETMFRRQDRLLRAYIKADEEEFLHPSVATDVYARSVSELSSKRKKSPMFVAASLIEFGTTEYFSEASGNNNYRPYSDGVPERSEPPRSVRYATDRNLMSLPPSQVSLVSKRLVHHSPRKMYTVTLEVPPGVQHGFIADGVMCGSLLSQTHPQSSDDIDAWCNNHIAPNSVPSSSSSSSSSSSAPRVRPRSDDALSAGPGSDNVRRPRR